MNNLSASWGEFLILRTRRNNSSVFAFSSTLNFSSSQMQVHSCLARQEMPQVSRQQKARPEPGPSSQTHLVLAQEGSFGGLCPPQTLEQQLPPRSCGLTLTRQRAKETFSNCNRWTAGVRDFAQHTKLEAKGLGCTGWLQLPDARASGGHSGSQKPISSQSVCWEWRGGRWWVNFLFTFLPSFLYSGHHLFGKLNLSAFDSPPLLFFTVSLKGQEIPSVTSSQKGCHQTPNVPQTRPCQLLHLKIIMAIIYTASALCLQGLFPLIPVRSILWLLLFYRWEHWGLQKWANLPKST